MSTTIRCLGIAVAVLSLAYGIQTQAQDEHGNGARCSLQTLKGSYGTLATGFVRDFPDPGQNPIVIQGRDTYDGAGHVTTTASSMLSGTTQFEVNGATGTYKVNPDCSGSTEYTNLPSQKFQIVKHGTEILGIVGGPNADSFTISFHSEKQ
jgi:hypothetical protein